MVTQGKGMTGTVLQGAREWTGPSYLARSREKSPKAEFFPFWLTYTLTPSPWHQGILPIQRYGLMGKGVCLKLLASLLFCPG